MLKIVKTNSGVRRTVLALQITTVDVVKNVHRTVKPVRDHPTKNVLFVLKDSSNTQPLELVKKNAQKDITKTLKREPVMPVRNHVRIVLVLMKVRNVLIVTIHTLYINLPVSNHAQLDGILKTQSVSNVTEPVKNAKAKLIPIVLPVQMEPS